jgi:ubiquinone/menaquinone biosynthesis C-methylase UbiE
MQACAYAHISSKIYSGATNFTITKSTPSQTFLEDLSPHLNADIRNYLWNPDFIRFLSEKAKFVKAKRLLDVGCGLGHWTRVLTSFMPDGSDIVGLDVEENFVIEARRTTDQYYNKKKKVHFDLGDSYEMPYPSNHFDVVTCHHLLCMVSSPQRVLAEMYRVLKPGGYIIIAEPNKSVALLASNTAFDSLSANERLDLVKLYLTSSMSKNKLGKGNDDIGQRVGELLKEMGLAITGVYNSDREFYLLPPYVSREQKALVEFVKLLAKAGSLFCVSPEKLREYYKAQDPDEAEFERLTQMSSRFSTTVLYQLEHGKFAGSIGGSTVVTIAKKLS